MENMNTDVRVWRVRLNYARILSASYLRCIGRYTSIDHITIDIFFLYRIKQTDSMLAWVRSGTDHKRLQNKETTSVTRSAAPHVPFFVLTTF